LVLLSKHPGFAGIFLLELIANICPTATATIAKGVATATNRAVIVAAAGQVNGNIQRRIVAAAKTMRAITIISKKAPIKDFMER